MIAGQHVLCKCKGVEGNSCIGLGIVAKKEIIMMCYCYIFEVAGWQEVWGIQSQFSSMDIVVVKETIYFSDAGCVHTPSKNVKNTKRKKSTIIILF